MSGHPSLINIAILLGLFVCPSGAEASFILDISAGARQTDNANLATITKKSDTISSFGFSFGGYTQIADYTGLALTIDINKEASATFSGLNLLSTGLSLTLSHKLGLGPSAVRLNLYASTSNDNYTDEYRDSTSYRMGIFGSQWVHERVKIGIGYEFDKRITASSYGITFGNGGGGGGSGGNNYAVSYGSTYTNIYDLQGHSGIVNAEVSVTEDDSLLLSYRYRSGEVVSVDTRSLKALNASTAYTADNAFEGLTAYRIPAVSHIGSIEFSRAILRKMSLNIGYSFNTTSGNGGNDYQTNSYNLVLAYSF